MRLRSTRLHAALLALVLTFGVSATACKTVQQPPVPQTTDQQTARLTEMNHLADVAEKTIDLARAAQDTEIQVYTAKLVPGFDAAKHETIQTAFKTFFDEARKEMQIARDVSTVDADRRKAVARIGTRVEALVASIQIQNPLVKATIGALLAAATMLNMTIV